MKAMKICRDPAQWKPVRNPVVTVGSYDGVHCAHRSIIDLLNRQAAALGGESVLISFSPHPRMVLQGEEAFRKHFRLLTTDTEKEALLAAAGLRNLLVLHFDADFAAMPAERFVREILVERLQVRRMIIGFNHNFGHDRQGGYAQMSAWGEQYGFAVERYPEYTVDGEAVSSSQVRRLLQAGRVESANRLLGYPYFINGAWHQDVFEASSKFKLKPAPGHYLTKVKVRNRYYYTVARIEEDIRFDDLPFLQEGDEIKVRFLKEISL